MSVTEMFADIQGFLSADQDIREVRMSSPLECYIQRLLAISQVANQSDVLVNRSRHYVGVEQSMLFHLTAFECTAFGERISMLCLR